MLKQFPLLGHSFNTYPLFYLLGFYAGVMALIFSTRGKKSVRQCVALGLYLLCGVFVFGKLTYIVLHFREFLVMQKEAGLFTAFKHEGLVAQGGLLGGILVLALVSRLRRQSFWQLSDSVAPSVALGQGIGRVGCFLAGCCRGRETDFFLGVAFPDEMNPLIFRHPVQLYESLLLVYLFFFLIEWRHEGITFVGEISLLYLLLASCIRFLMEYFRWGVSAQVMFGMITQAQIVCLGIMAVSLGFMAKHGFRAQGKKEAAL